MALLQSQMTRYHQDVRPRYSNPTYASSNVGSTLGMFVPYPSRNLQQNRSYSTVKPISRGNTPKASEIAPSRRGSSRLSSFGSNSLKSLNRYISDKQVYQKQQKHYNIISVQPKQYEDTIKNEDRNYYKKLQIENEIANKLNTNKKILSQLNNPEKPAQKIIRGKYLNNVDEVADIM